MDLCTNHKVATKAVLDFNTMADNEGHSQLPLDCQLLHSQGM
jgi:hypothetical protein